MTGRVLISLALVAVGGWVLFRVAGCLLRLLVILAVAGAVVEVLAR